MDVVEKLTQISTIINEIEKEDPVVAAVLTEGYSLSLNLLKEIETRGSRDSIDISNHLDVVSRVLDINLEQLILSVVNKNSQENSKEPDAATLEFITSDLDDYEKFLAQNKAKDSIDFLSKEI